MVKVDKQIEEETARLDQATEDNDIANADYDAEETRWGREKAAHEALLAELEAELDALNQCIDLFSSPEMAEVGDDLLEDLNS